MAVHQKLTVTEIANSVNISANTSRIRILWQSTQSGESWNGYTRTAYYYVSINGGAEKEYAVSYTLPKASTTTIVDTTLTITHKVDGTGTVKVRTWMDTGISAGEIKNEETLILTTIPKASTITAAYSKTLGEKCRVEWTPKSSDFWYRLVFSLGSWSYTTEAVNPKTTSRYEYTDYPFPMEIAKQFPNDTRGRMKATLYTYPSKTSQTHIGSASSREFTVTIPENDETRPTATMSLSPISSLPSPFDKLYIKGRTKVKATFTDEEGKYGASIVSIKLNVGGKNYGSPYTSEYLSTPLDSLTIKGTVTDSRGFSRTYTEEIKVISYENPKILPASDESEIICTRCDDNGNFTDSGTHLKVKVRRSYSTVEADEVQMNFCEIRYRYRSEATNKFSDWKTLLAKDDVSTDTVDSEPIADVVSSAETAYFVQIGVVDDIGSSDAIQLAIPTDFVTISIPEEHKGKSIGIFRHAAAPEGDENRIDIDGFLHGGGVDNLTIGKRLTATAEAPLDLNDYIIPDNYYSPSLENSQYIANTPYKDGGFGMEVRHLQSANYIRQTIYYGRTTWLRHWNGTEWSGWVRYLMTDKDTSFSVDFVMEEGTKNGWTYKVWKRGTYELFGIFDITVTEDSQTKGSLYYSEQFKLPTPFAVSDAVVAGTATGWFVPITGGLSNGANGENPKENIGFRVYNPSPFTNGSTFSVRLFVKGKLS